MRHLTQPSSVQDVILQQQANDQSILGSRPRWGLQHKGRNEHDDRMREDHHQLKDGFASFYAKREQQSSKLADSAKRHWVQPESKEASWRPCYKRAEQAVLPPKAFGKRYIEPGKDTQGQEFDQLPRGRKHVVPPSDSFQQEIQLVQSRRRVVNEDTGVARADEVHTDRDADDETAMNMGRKKHLSAGQRNGIPKVVDGDKLYAHVQFSPEYLSSSKAMRREEAKALGQATHRVEVSNAWSVKEQARQRDHDIGEVRSLPKLPKLVHS